MRGLRLSFYYAQFLAATALFVWTLSSPIVGLCFLLSAKACLIYLAASAVLAWCFLLLFSQWGTLRLLQGQLPRSYGLRNSYELAQADVSDRPRTRPALMTFPDPIPNVFVLRSPGGKGLILLSEGFISILDEKELRFVLTAGIAHLASGAVVLQSACIFALTLIQHTATSRREGFGYASSVKTLMLFPWRRFFSSLAEAAATATRGSSAMTRRVARGFIRGASKLHRAERLYGQEAFLPGLVYLGVQR